MKRISTIIVVSLLSGIIFWMGFDYRSNQNPKEYYQVYLDDEIVGVINSKAKLEKKIDNEGKSIKEKYNVDTVYEPNGLEIRKILSYNGNVASVDDVYNKIKEKKPFTVHGYQYTIKNDKLNYKIYVLEKDVFKNAIEQTIKTFVGENQYNNYLNKTQSKIDTTGVIINDISLEDNITIKETNISADEDIYTKASELAKYFLFGTTEQQKVYTVLLGDTIETVAFQNKISVEEFLISNPKFSNKSNLLFPGQQVVIGVTDPQIRVSVSEYSVQDVVSKYKTEEKYDDSISLGTTKVIQEGEDGLDRIAQNTKIINGNIVQAVTTPIEQLKPTISKIVVIGQKYVASVGSLSNWLWPTQSGWTLTSTYGYRINPFTYAREFHGALDIAGPGYGSKIYAANNGVIEEAGWHSSYGYHIIINHNNGYYTLYAHMQRLAITTVGQVVEKGAVIGYMGSTGDATGPHLHFEGWKGKPWYGGVRFNPMTLYQ